MTLFSQGVLEGLFDKSSGFVTMCMAADITGGERSPMTFQMSER